MLEIVVMVLSAIGVGICISLGIIAFFEADRKRLLIYLGVLVMISLLLVYCKAYKHDIFDDIPYRVCRIEIVNSSEHIYKVTLEKRKDFYVSQYETYMTTTLPKHGDIVEEKYIKDNYKGN